VAVSTTKLLSQYQSNQQADSKTRDNFCPSNTATLNINSHSQLSMLQSNNAATETSGI